jgi:hypothetical protein
MDGGCCRGGLFEWNRASTRALERDGSRRNLQGPNNDASQSNTSNVVFYDEHVIVYVFMRDDIDVGT